MKIYICTKQDLDTMRVELVTDTWDRAMRWISLRSNRVDGEIETWENEQLVNRTRIDTKNMIVRFTKDRL